MKKVIITRGLPASGKSTWAKNLLDRYTNRYKRINKDLLREMLDNSTWSRDNEKFILHLRDLIILESLNNGKHVIVDDTNLAEKHINHIEKLVKGKARVEIKDFTDVPLGVCIERDLKRDRSVGEQVIKKMYYQYLHKTSSQIEYDKNLPNCIIVDCDGTLNRVGDRSPYDGTNCGKDLPIPHTISIVNHFKSKGHKVFVFSGLTDEYFPQREKWLMNHGVEYDLLKMRRTGDMRKDSVIKEEFYKEYIENKFNIQLILDDRPQMLRFWNSIGLGTKLMSVGHSEIDF